MIGKRDGGIEMTHNHVLRNHRFPLSTWKKTSTRVNYPRHLILQAHYILFSLALIIIVAGCATPHIQSVDPKPLFNSKLLGFIHNGVTTKEEVLIKLGNPSGQFEGERIFTYQLRVDQIGDWHLVAPHINANGLREWPNKTCSLVLVFGDDEVLQKHSLVEAK
jgi:hypothetical protein